MYEMCTWQECNTVSMSYGMHYMVGIHMHMGILLLCVLSILIDAHQHRLVQLLTWAAKSTRIREKEVNSTCSIFSLGTNDSPADCTAIE